MEFKTRCHCTMEEVRSGVWERPKGGYLAPKKDCEECGGKGFFKATVGLPKIVWAAACPVCHTWIGTHYQYGENDSPRSLVVCVNPQCREHGRQVPWSRTH